MKLSNWSKQRVHVLFMYIISFFFICSIKKWWFFWKKNSESHSVLTIVTATVCSKIQTKTSYWKSTIHFRQRVLSGEKESFICLFRVLLKFKKLFEDKVRKMWTCVKQQNSGKYVKKNNFNSSRTKKYYKFRRPETGVCWQSTLKKNNFVSSPCSAQGSKSTKKFQRFSEQFFLQILISFRDLNNPRSVFF